MSFRLLLSFNYLRPPDPEELLLELPDELLLEPVSFFNCPKDNPAIYCKHQAILKIV